MKQGNTHHQLREVYREHAMSDSMVWRWVKHFNKGSENVHDDLRSNRPSVVNEGLVCVVEEKKRQMIFSVPASENFLWWLVVPQQGQRSHLHIVCIAGGIIL
jgi:transposase